MKLREYQESIFFEKYRLLSNYSFAQWLGIHSATLSRYYSGKFFLSGKNCAKILEKCEGLVTFEDLSSTEDRKPKYKWAKLKSFMDQKIQHKIEYNKDI